MRVTRRQFLTAAAAAAVGPYAITSNALGAGDRPAASNRIALGSIGIGKQGEYHFRSLVRNSDFQVVAVCEVYRKFRDMAVDLANETYRAGGAGQPGVKGYVDYYDLLARTDIDAVLIATPDHHHAIPSIHAAASGKDVYCEKPLSLTIREARAMVTAARRYGRVFQTGSQQRSDREFWQACTLVRNGCIGKVKTVHVSVGGPSRLCDLPAEAVPDGLDWDRWLGPAPWRPFHPVLRPPHNNDFPAWRSYQEYSGGGMTDWGAHHFDIAQWGLGMDETGPVEIHPPGTKHPRWLTYVYADGTIMYHGGQTDDGRGVNGVLFTGTEGKVEVNRGYLRTWPASLAALAPQNLPVALYRSRGHHQDWVDCIRARRRPVADVEIGCRSVSVCHLGNIAYWLKRSLKWDPAREDFIGDPAASRWLDRPKRAPWAL
ncbi:MAG: Gfo/Idh/MocA family oxidoreductase [Planctomycetes bacterium]|nr:Gfo/Idh/MocA family oxidoreductase [Planctomycetota bacterium]